MNDTISDGKVLRNDSSDGRMIYRFHCNVGFRLSGSTVISCLHGKWNGTKPSCQLISKFKCNLYGNLFKAESNIGTHSVRELFCSCQEEVRKWLLNERACTKVHYWDVYLSSVEHSKSIGF